MNNGGMEERVFGYINGENKGNIANRKIKKRERLKMCRE